MSDDIVRLFLHEFFPQDGPAKIMEVRGVIFRKRPNGRWVAESGDLWQTSEKIVEELCAVHDCGRDYAWRRDAVYAVMSNIAHRSPTDGKDVVTGLLSRGFKLVSPASAASPTASA